jgi:hypothetical protein
MSDGPNLLTPSQANGSGWADLFALLGVGATATLTSVSTPSLNGISSLQITKTSLAADSFNGASSLIMLPFTLVAGLETGGTPITAGKTYTALASYYGQGLPVDVMFTLGWIDSDGHPLADDGSLGSASPTSVGPAGSEDGWIQSVQTKVAPVGAVSATLLVQIHEGNGLGADADVGSVSYMSSVSLAEGTSTVWQAPPTFVASAAQRRVFHTHRTICQRLGFPQATLHNRIMRGSVTAPNTVGNTRYIPSGPIADLASLYANNVLVWWVNMAFLRGEQQHEMDTVGFVDTELLQSQIPAIDNSGAFVSIQPLDVIVDAQGAVWKVENPALNPDQTFWNFMASRER